LEGIGGEGIGGEERRGEERRGEERRGETTPFGFNLMRSKHMNKDMNKFINSTCKHFVIVHCILLYASRCENSSNKGWETHRTRKASACAAVFTVCAKDVNCGPQQALPGLCRSHDSASASGSPNKQLHVVMA